ncbi:MAG: PAS domain S-box protein, partial [Bacteroidales bacterium]
MMKDLKYSELRKKAEKIVREKGIQSESYYQESLEKLIEELNIYQIELEHQNEELLQTQDNLNHVNQKFSDLYHNAPVGYFTIDKDNRIADVNDKGAELLTENRKELLNSKFTNFIHPDFQDHYYHHHRQIINKNRGGICELKISTQTKHEYYVQLESIPTNLFNTGEMAIRTAVFDISDRKKVEQENLNQLAILKNISDSVIVTDMQGEITFWNKGAEEIFGYTEKEMLGKTPALLYPDMDPSKLDYDLEKIIAGEDYIGEWKGRTKNNQIIWVNIRTSALLDINDKPIGFLGVAKDVTERKKQEINRLRLASIVEFSDDAIESMDVEGNILSWNKGAEKIYGYKADEMVGENALKLYPQKLKNELKQTIEKIKQGKVVANFKSRRKRKNGDIIDVSITFSPLKSESGEILGVSVITRDITEQISNESALKESELKYQTIYENSGDGILLMNKSGIIDCNNQICRLLGYEKNELLKQSPVDFSPEKQDGGKISKDLGTKYIQKAFKNGYHAFNWKHQKKDGSILNTRVGLKRIELRGEEVILALVHDLTSIYNYQKKLKERNEEVLAQNEEYQALNEELHEANDRLNIINKHIELSEKKFRTAFKTSPDALAINRLSDGLYVEINEGFANITGFTEEDVKGKTSKDIDIWGTNKDRDILVQELTNNGAVTNLEFQYIMKDGSVKTGLMSAGIININNEDCILSITRDISERKRLQTILEQSEEKYRFLVESVHAISWEFD